MIIRGGVGGCDGVRETVGSGVVRTEVYVGARLDVSSVRVCSRGLRDAGVKVKARHIEAPVFCQLLVILIFVGVPG